MTAPRRRKATREALVRLARGLARSFSLPELQHAPGHAAERLCQPERGCLPCLRRLAAGFVEREGAAR